MEIEDDSASLPVDNDALITPTPAFNELFATLEHTAPFGDLTGLGLLLGWNFGPFG